MSYIIKFPIDGRDSYLCKVSGGYSLTTDIDKAILFKEEKAATNTLKSSLSKTFPYKNRGLVSYHEDKKMEEVPKVIKPSTYTKVDLEEFKYYTYTWRIEEFIFNQIYDMEEEKIDEYVNYTLSKIENIMNEIYFYFEL